ncbi:rhodanese-like domain-containing protein [Aeromicrobium stalagmiti]|uniref:rhodanese-like domain-containing protein n=1 Tax=Aeromicrobium stalagmiti TaxID=2738988 RepID=UPI001568588F|nr:rhodanese-like domain-containing protein [Aeromicrobium stalagmiti]NRQ49495.1 sulfurtransferase [Aeromicrobium stalagmiti]
MTTTFATVDDLLDAARARLVRLDPLEAARRVGAGALVVDIRPAWQREADGEIPGSVIVERNHLEWRLHPSSGANLPLATVGQEWIVVCTEGYTSSLAASALVSLGLPASDVVGGIHAWRAAGLPMVAGPTPVEHRVGSTSAAPRSA